MLSPARSEFDRLHARYLAARYGEPQHRSYDVPSIVAAGAGIHMDEAERVVAHHFEDVGVAADEQAGPQVAEVAGSPFVVIAGIASDVGHIYA